MFSSLKFSLVLITLTIFFAACASVPQKVVVTADEGASKTSPDWAGKTWSQGNAFFFSGISDMAGSVYEARQQAYSDALTKAAEYIGVSLNNTTSQFLDNNFDSMNAQTSLTIEETKLSQGIIKDFKYTQSNGKFTGFILMEYSKKDLDEEKQRQLDLIEKKKAAIAARKNIGEVAVSAPQNLKEMIPALKQFLQKQGYLVGDNGKAFATIKEISSSTQRANQFSMVCFLNLEINFNGQIFNFTSRGYGTDETQALINAKTAKQWLSVFEDLFIKAQENN
jgi:hypothetical protein